MALVVKQKEYELMTEGLHNVNITRVDDLGKVDTQYGTKEKARIIFTATDQKGKGGDSVDAVMTVNCVLGAKSSLGKLLNSLGITAGSEFDLNDLVGTKCQIVVQHNESDGKTYANIVTVLKVKKASQEV
jgi:hypothetical protein